MNKTFYVIRILLAFLVIVSSFSCKKEVKEEVPKGQLWVTTEKGLWLREEPNVNGKQIILIPFKEMVNIYEITDKDDTVSGVTDRWGRVKYNDKMGWAFRGFLNNVDPNNQEDTKESEMDADGKFLIGTWVLEKEFENEENKSYQEIFNNGKEHKWLSGLKLGAEKTFSENRECLEIIKKYDDINYHEEKHYKWEYHNSEKYVYFLNDQPDSWKILELNKNYLKVFSENGNIYMLYKKKL